MRRGFYKRTLDRIADHRCTGIVAILCVLGATLPTGIGVSLSFASMTPTGQFAFGSLSGYHSLSSSGRVLELALIAMRSCVVTLASMIVAIPVAFYIARMKSAWRRVVLLALLIMPWLVSDMLRAFGWQLLLSSNGPLAALLGNQASIWLTAFRYSFPGVVLGLVSSMLPVGVFSVLTAMPTANDNEWKAASEIGSQAHIFRVFALGRAHLGVALGAAGIFALSFFSSAEPHFLQGPVEMSVGTMASSLADDGVPALLAFGSVLFALALVVGAGTWIVLFALRRVHANSEGELLLASRSNLLPIWFRNFVQALLNIAAEMIPPALAVGSGLLCLAPVIAIVMQAFHQRSGYGSEWTFNNFVIFFQSEDTIAALTNSMGVAIAVSVLAVTAAFLLSLTLWRRSWLHAVLLLCATLVLMPGEAYSLSLLQALRLLGRSEGGWWVVVLAQTLWAIPFATGTLLLANRSISASQLESAFELGRGPIQVGILIAKINAKRLCSVGFLVFTMSLGEYIRASYLGAALVTLPNVIYGRLSDGLLSQGGSIMATEVIVLICCGSAALSILTLGIRVRLT